MAEQAPPRSATRGGAGDRRRLAVRGVSSSGLYRRPNRGSEKRSTKYGGGRRLRIWPDSASQSPVSDDTRCRHRCLMRRSLISQSRGEPAPDVRPMPRSAGSDMVVSPPLRTSGSRVRPPFVDFMIATTSPTTFFLLVLPSPAPRSSPVSKPPAPEKTRIRLHPDPPSLARLTLQAPTSLRASARDRPRKRAGRTSTRSRVRGYPRSTTRPPVLPIDPRYRRLLLDLHRDVLADPLHRTSGHSS